MQKIDIEGQQLICWRSCLVTGYCKALPVNPYGKADDTVQYLQSLHAFHGFDKIFIQPPERTGVQGSLSTIASAFRMSSEIYKKLEKVEFIQYVPESLHRYSSIRQRKLIDCIYQHLADVNSSRSVDDIAELRLNHIVDLYHSWVISCELQALMICSTPGSLLRPVSYLDSSGGIGYDAELILLRNSLKWWFYTHLSNFDLKLPYSEKPLDLQKELSDLNDKIGEARFSAGKPNLIEKSHKLREELLAKLEKYAFRITQFAQHNTKRVVVIATSCAVTVLTENLFALSPLVVEIPYLIRHLRDDIFHPNFDSHFVFEPPPFVHIPDYKQIVDKIVVLDGLVGFSIKPKIKEIPVGDGSSYIHLRVNQEAFWQQMKLPNNNRG